LSLQHLGEYSASRTNERTCGTGKKCTVGKTSKGRSARNSLIVSIILYHWKRLTKMANSEHGSPMEVSMHVMYLLDANLLVRGSSLTEPFLQLFFIYCTVVQSARHRQEVGSGEVVTYTNAASREYSPRSVSRSAFSRESGAIYFPQSGPSARKLNSHCLGLLLTYRTQSTSENKLVQCNFHVKKATYLH
jgi:hypothetical protein